MPEPKAKKPHTSNEVKNRYRKKAIKNYSISLNVKYDQDCIDFLAAEKKKGLSPSMVLKNFIRGGYYN